MFLTKPWFSGGSLVVFIATTCKSLFRYKVLKIYNVTRKEKPYTKPSTGNFAQQLWAKTNILCAVFVKNINGAHCTLFGFVHYFLSQSACTVAKLLFLKMCNSVFLKTEIAVVSLKTRIITKLSFFTEKTITDLQMWWENFTHKSKQTRITEKLHAYKTKPFCLGFYLVVC